MPNSAIRTVLMGIEAVRSVQAATLYNIYQDVDTAPTMKDNFAREKIRVHNGTMVGATLTAVGPRSSELTIPGLPIFADHSAPILFALCGPPTSTQIGATGVYNHVFKLGPAAEPPTVSLLTYNGVRWRRQLGASLTTVSFKQDKEKAPRMDVAFMGPAADPIEVPVTFDGGTTPATVTRKAVAHGVVSAGAVTSYVIDDGGAGYTGTVTATVPTSVVHSTTHPAPGAVTLTAGVVTAVALGVAGTGLIVAPTPGAVVDTWGPMGYRHLNGTINSILSEIMSYTLNLDNQRAGRWTGQRGASMRRMTRGLANNSLESMHDYVSYGSSYKAYFDTEANLGAWQAEYQNQSVDIDLVTAIQYPTFIIDVPNIIVEDTAEPDDGPEAVQSITGEGTYSSSPATSVYFTLRNTTASYAAT